MLNKKLASATVIGLLLFGCTTTAQKPTTQAIIAPSENTTPSPIATSVPPKASTAPVETDTFNNALSVAIGANTIAQSAHSSIDREVVVNKWEEAIALMKSVPPSDKNYATAQKKIIEYRNNLSASLQKPETIIKKTSQPNDQGLVAVINNAPQAVTTNTAQNNISEVMNGYWTLDKKEVFA